MMKKGMLGLGLKIGIGVCIIGILGVALFVFEANREYRNFPNLKMHFSSHNPQLKILHCFLRHILLD